MENREKRIERIEKELESLKVELGSVRGSETEVYARIVGYYRSVKNWNAGKREEYGQRKLFKVEKHAVESPEPGPASAQEGGSEEEIASIAMEVMAGASSRGVTPDPKGYLLFARDLCPNCPPVKRYMDGMGMEGVHLDVDTEEGLSAARRYGVMASPTVIFLDEGERELFRAHSLSDLKEKFQVTVV